jgi:pyrimidine operon attenuation protein/uracil phosphoribosyltransferase
METQILDSQQIRQKTERIAYEIYENTFSEQVLFVGGIKGNGFEFAERLVEKLNEISSNNYPKGIRLFEISLDKKSPLSSSINLSLNNEDLNDSVVILADDVINSGSTLIHAASRLLESPIKTIKTAILVNRTHRKFPILADYVGLDITTTLKDNIVVEFGEKERAYLV